MRWILYHSTPQDGAVQSEAPIIFDEDSLKEVPQGVKNNETPGPDGLPAEFYKTFFDNFTPPGSMSKAVTI